MALARYATISKDELERLLDGRAPNFLNDLQNERYYLLNSTAQSDAEEFLQESDGDSLLFDEGKMKAFLQGIHHKLEKQSDLSNQRLQSADGNERLDEIIRLFALGKRPWSQGQDAQDFGGLSEDELVAEAQKRGLRMRVDVRDWMVMHELVTGITVAEWMNSAALAKAQPWIEKAKCNPNFPSGCINRIENSVNAVCACIKEIRSVGSLADPSTASGENHAESNEVEQTKRSIQTELLDTILSRISMAEMTLPQCLLKIAVMEKRVNEMGIAAFDADARENNRLERKAARVYGCVSTFHRKYMPWKACRNGAMESARLAQMIESKIKDLASKLRANILSGTELEAAARIEDECVRLERLISISDWEDVFETDLATETRTESMSAVALLSMAVTGGADCLNTDSPLFPVTYLTIDQTRAVADVLEPLSSEELKRKHHQSDPAEPEVFYQFRKFYLRAAKLKSAVVVQFF